MEEEKTIKEKEYPPRENNREYDNRDRDRDKGDKGKYTPLSPATVARLMSSKKISNKKFLDNLLPVALGAAGIGMLFSEGKMRNENRDFSIRCQILKGILGKDFATIPSYDDFINAADPYNLNDQTITLKDSDGKDVVRTITASQLRNALEKKQREAFNNIQSAKPKELIFGMTQGATAKAVAPAIGAFLANKGIKNINEDYKENVEDINDDPNLSIREKKKLRRQLKDDRDKQMFLNALKVPASIMMGNYLNNKESESTDSKINPLDKEINEKALAAFSK